MRVAESGRLCVISVAEISCISIAPASVPTIRTWPPDNGVPPTTTAVIALSSIRLPRNDGSDALTRAVWMIPATAASAALRTYTASSVRRTGHAREALASGLPPMATT